jgi:hypothetical protein
MPEARKAGTSAPADDRDGRLSRLIREGIVRLARATLSPTLLADPPPRPNVGVSAVRIILAERREGR